MKTPFESFVDLARSETFSPSRILLALIVIFVLTSIGSLIGLGVAIAPALFDARATLSIEEINALIHDPTTILFATLFGLGAGAPATWAALGLAHPRRSFRDLLGAERRLRIGAVGVGFAAAALACVVGVGFGAAVGVIDLGWPAPSLRWLLLAALFTGLIAAQASAEELVFRGYVLQSLAARWRSPWVWGAAPSVVFGLGHWSAGGGEHIWWLVASTTVFGLFACALVARTGGLSHAIGFHIGHNVSALIVLDSGIGLSGIGLIPIQIAPDGFALLMMIDALVLATLYLALTRIMRPEDPRLAVASSP